jgi:hypothetical protein
MGVNPRLVVVSLVGPVSLFHGTGKERFAVFEALVDDDVVRGHSYSLAVLDGDGDMILETVEDRLSKRTLISP